MKLMTIVNINSFSTVIEEIYGPIFYILGLENGGWQGRAFMLWCQKGVGVVKAVAGNLGGYAIFGTEGVPPFPFELVLPCFRLVVEQSESGRRLLSSLGFTPPPFFIYFFFLFFRGRGNFFSPFFYLREGNSALPVCVDG
jgi:hypothetical protein